MAKHKNKHGQSISVPELMQLAEEALARPEREGAVERALEWLRSAEGKLRQTTAPAGKKVSVPPHLVAARAALPGLVARAHFLLARKAADLSQLRAALGEAAARAPEKADYLLACGAARLLAGEEAQADGDFARAAALQPEMAGAVRTSRAVALGALACGHGRQANEALAAVPETDRDAGWHRLATICGEFGGPEGRLAGVHGDFSTIAALARLAAGDRAAAAPVLEAPPVLDHNPSRIEAAEIATRAFHAGALRIEDGRLAAGLASFRTARQLVEAHCLPLPWVARMPAWCHLAAERAFVADRALAMEFWTLARALAPNDKIAGGNLALARRALAAAAWRDGDFERAAALWQEALSTSPDDEQVLHPLALALERLNRKADALAHWRSLARIWRRKAKASDADPQLRPRVFALEDRILQLMIELDRPEQEISAEFEEALKVDPGNLIMRRRAADYLLEIGRGVQALKHLQQIEQQQGPSAEITTRRAVALASLKRTNEAIEAFNRALAFDPPDSAARPAYLLFLGNLAEKAEDKKEYPRAVQFCEQQLHLDPAYLPAFVHLARLSFSMEKKETAEAYIRRALDIAPENAGLRVRIGAAYLANRIPKKATAQFKRALELDSSFEILSDIGEIYFEKGDMRNAFKYFDLAAKKAGAEQFLYLAGYAAEAGRKKDLARYLDEAKRLDPGHPLPHLFPVFAMLSDPFSLLLGFDRFGELMADLALAEEKARARPEFARYLEVVQDIRNMLHNAPIPDLFDDDDDDDDDDDFFPFPPPTRRR